MNNTIKMVLHCGKRTIELDERTLYETGTLRALAEHHKKSPNPYWRDVFGGLADLAHGKSCDDSIISTRFLEHVEQQEAGRVTGVYNNRHRTTASETLRKKLEQAEHARAVFVQREQEQLEQDG